MLYLTPDIELNFSECHSIDLLFTKSFENVSRRPNSKLEARNHKGCPLVRTRLAGTCAVQPEEGRFPQNKQAAFAYGQSEATTSNPAPLQPMRKCRHFELLFFSPLNFSSKQPSQFPPFLYKKTLSSLVVQTCLWLAIVCVFQIAIRLLFPSKLDFAG